MRTATALVTGAAVLALGVAGCGSSSSSKSSTGSAVNPNGAEVSPAGDIPDNQAFVAYAPPGGGYSVKVPEGWARTTSGGATTFSDKLNSIRMETMATGSEPKPAGAKVTHVKRKAGTAALTTYLVQSKPDAVTGKTRRNAVEQYAFAHNGKDVVLTLTGPKGADNVDPWKIVTDSLRFTQ
jgi:hypothetical protein